MTALVASERHLWFNLSNIKEKDKSFLLDGVNTVVERFQEAKKQPAFQQYLPGRSKVSGAPPHNGHNKSRALPLDLGLGKCSKSKSDSGKMYLRNIILAR